MAGKTSRGRQTTLPITRPASPTQAAASTGKASPGEEHSAPPASAMDTESVKRELLSSLRKELIETLKTEVRTVLENEMALIRTDISTVRSELKECRQSITSELSTLSGTVKVMEESLSTCTDDISQLQKEVRRLTAVTDTLQNKCEDLEARSRRNNVRIVGVPEAQTCSTSSVSALLKQAFDLKEAPLLDRAHRSLQPVPGQGRPPRVIVARVHYFQDCANILRLAREKQRIKMNGMTISVFPDYTAKTAKARAAFNDIRRQLRGIDGVRFGILHPARLRITYQNTEKTFSTPEEAQLYINQNITGH